jgi:hypothetical protein
MKVVSTGSFDVFQRALTFEVIRAIKSELERIGTSDVLAEQLTGRLAFAVTSIFDDVAGFQLEGRPVSPMLTFRTDDQTLEVAGGNSRMHEYVYELLPIVFFGRSS